MKYIIAALLVSLAASVNAQQVDHPMSGEITVRSHGERSLSLSDDAPRPLLFPEGIDQDQSDEVILPIDTAAVMSRVTVTIYRGDDGQPIRITGQRAALMSAYEAIRKALELTDVPCD